MKIELRCELEQDVLNSAIEFGYKSIKKDKTIYDTYRLVIDDRNFEGQVSVLGGIEVGMFEEIISSCSIKELRNKTIIE